MNYNIVKGKSKQPKFSLKVKDSFDRIEMNVGLLEVKLWGIEVGPFSMKTIKTMQNRLFRFIDFASKKSMLARESFSK